MLKSPFLLCGTSEVEKGIYLKLCIETAAYSSLDSVQFQESFTVTVIHGPLTYASTITFM